MNTSMFNIYRKLWRMFDEKTAKPYVARHIVIFELLYFSIILFLPGPVRQV